MDTPQAKGIIDTRCGLAQLAFYKALNLQNDQHNDEANTLYNEFKTRKTPLQFEALFAPYFFEPDNTRNKDHNTSD